MENNKTAFITGSTEGIGKATAMGLSKAGFHVIIHGRNETKARAVKQEIETLTKNTVDYISGDLGSLKKVKEIAEAIKNKYPRLDVLINNAGLMNSERKTTDDGYEMNFGVNYLAPFLLTHLLLDNLKASTQGRIVTLSSGLYTGGKPDFNDLNWDTRKYDMIGAYSTSKLYNLYFSIELADVLKDTAVTSNALHPGVVNTSLARDVKGVMKVVFDILGKVFFVTAEKGAATSIYVATAPELSKVSGKYFDNKKEAAIKSPGDNVENRKKLWALSKELVKGYLV